MENLCPCGSGKKYDSCCAPIIKGKITAPTAEALMRARYSAYVKQEINFIRDSCIRLEGETEIDMDETKRWSKESEWTGLKIHGTEKGGVADTEGIVDFSAFYSRKGLADEHREVAKFQKIDENWMYTEGKIASTTIVRSSPKVGRNEPCPCGSGKKYKQCCGK